MLGKGYRILALSATPGNEFDSIQVRIIYCLIETGCVISEYIIHPIGRDKKPMRCEDGNERRRGFRCAAVRASEGNHPSENHSE